MELLTKFLQSLLTYQDLGLFVMRLLVGTLFLYSGTRKIRDLKNFAKHNGLSMPVAIPVVLFEIFGGIGLILGIFTQLAALMIMAVMLGAMYFQIVKWKSPYWAQDKGWEYDLMWLVMCGVILTSGGGSIAIYPLI